MEAKPDRQLEVGLALLAVLVGLGLIPTVADSLCAWGVIPHNHQPVLSVYTLGVLITASALAAGLLAWKNRSAAPSMVVYALVSIFVSF